MQITKRNVGLTVDNSLMRLYVAAPQPEGQYPGILFYSDIYQLGEPIIRLSNHLAGYGFVVAAMEIFHRLEPIGTVIHPDDLGRLRGNENAARTAIAEYDADTRAALNWLKDEPTVAPGQWGAMGFCIGGHLAFRAALQPEVKVAVCCYPTGIHSGKLGKEPANTIQQVSDIQGSILLIFGTLDPHIPVEGRQTILQALTAAQVNYKVVEYEANHTFMRDDGYRYDPVATDAAWKESVDFLKQVFGNQ